MHAVKCNILIKSENYDVYTSIWTEFALEISALFLCLWLATTCGFYFFDTSDLILDNFLKGEGGLWLIIRCYQIATN